MSLLTEGQAVRGTYEVERVLGEGAFAVVYRARGSFPSRPRAELPTEYEYKLRLWRRGIAM